MRNNDVFTHIFNHIRPLLSNGYSGGHLPARGPGRAVSPRGARGMMQPMPFTAKQMNVSDPFDPVENIEGGVKYLKELLGTFGGNLLHAVAAYNAGPEAGQKYGGIPPC